MESRKASDLPPPSAVTMLKFGLRIIAKDSQKPP
jgi:hypothetical protein